MFMDFTGSKCENVLEYNNKNKATGRSPELIDDSGIGIEGKIYKCVIY